MSNLEINNENVIEIKKIWRNYKIFFFIFLVLTVGLINQIASIPPISEQGDTGKFLTTVFFLPIGSILISIITARSSYKISRNKKSLFKGLFGIWPFPFPLGPFFAFFATMYEYRKAINKPFSKTSLVIFWVIFAFTVLLVIETVLFPSQQSLGTLLGI